MKRKQEYYLVDFDRGRTQEKLLRRCEVAARIAIKYGPNMFTDERIAEFWNGKGFAPSPRTLWKAIKNPNVKWYIHNFLHGDGIWNGDFIGGITEFGRMTWCRFTFPTFRWVGNRDVYDLLKLNPYHGDIVWDKPRYFNRWNQAPALYFPCDKSTISYVAGVLATGEKCGNIAKYNRKSSDIIKTFGIPFEYRSKNCKASHLSPIWPALFSKYMPEGYRERWLNVPKAANAEIYAAILWRIYSKKRAFADAMPYLPSNRTIYNKFGNVKFLERERVRLNMVELDHRVLSVVREWDANAIENDVNSMSEMDQENV